MGKPYVQVTCPNCDGHGVVDFGYHNPGDCPDCSSGRVTIYESDTVAQYPGGPLRGKWPGKYREVKP
jgi:hypothetical protein